MSYVVINNLSKSIKGNSIFKNINVKFEKGKIYGIYGSNGCGKTMFFRALCGLITCTEGDIIIDGKELGKEIDFPDSCGVIIETPGFWGEYTAFENLKQIAMIKKIVTDKQIEEVLIRVGLNPKEKKKVGKYSLGMKQKLGIAQAIMEAPELLILDEPTNALDEDSVENFIKILNEEKERGATIIICSHIKHDIETLSDYKYKMVDGNLSLQ